MRGAFAIGLILLAAACSATQTPASVAVSTPSPVPTRDPSKDGLPLLADVSARGSAHSFMGGDDHVTFGITNRGRDVLELVIDAGAWLHDHTIAMGTSAACNAESNPDLITCGPVYSGEERTFSVKAFPETAGTFHYQVRFFSRERGRLLPIVGNTGAQQVIGLDELVDQQDRQVPGFVPTPYPTS